VSTKATVRDWSSLRQVRIDTPAEEAYYVHGGILPYVLRQLL
jgi:aconitase A